MDDKAREGYPRILVIGWTGSGKTTTARILAKHFQGVQVDTSDLIAADYASLFPSDPVHSRVKAWQRQLLYHWANFRIAQKDDPGHFARRPFRGEYPAATPVVVSGCRRQVEVAAALSEFDLVVWKTSENGFQDTDDPRMGPDLCDARLPWVGVDERGDMADRIIRIVAGALAKPRVYIAGRYRHWRVNSKKYDMVKMRHERTQELTYRQIVLAAGFRVFAPCNSFCALDKLWVANRIIAHCSMVVERLRPPDCIIVRPGWDSTERGRSISAGTRHEIAVARSRGLTVYFPADEKECTQILEEVGIAAKH